MTTFRSSVASLLAPFTLLAAAATAQGTSVTTNADAGPGSLRAALLAANASGAANFVVDVGPGGTAGPIVLASPLPAIVRSGLVIRAANGAGGRLVVDARGPTASGGAGLDLQAAGMRLALPCTVLVGQGHGVLVQADGVRLDDLEVVGNRGRIGIGVLGGADDVVIGRALVDTFQEGIVLENCARARIADDGTNTADVRSCSGPAIRVTNGAGHRVGAFACSASELGVMAVGTADLRLGRAGAPRSVVIGCRQQGLRLQQCTAVTLANADVAANGAAGGHGVDVAGGSGFVAADCAMLGNAWGGVLLHNGTTAARIGPGVVTRGVFGADDFGLTVRDASVVSVLDSTFGPDHRAGITLGPGASGNAAEVTICRCTIVGNRLAGVSVTTSDNVLVCSSTVANNLGEGIEAISPSLANAPRGLVVSDSTIRGNVAHGMLVHFVDGVRVGPGNRIDDNLFGGMQVNQSPNVVVRDNPSIAGNRNGGIWFIDCTNGTVARTTFRDNRGSTVWGVRCSNMSFGPGIDIGTAVGTGIELEGSQACRVFGSRIAGCSGIGLRVAPGFGIGAGSAVLVQSCLLANNAGLALLHSGGPSVSCELTTIAGNLRGVASGPNPLSLDSCIVWGNALEDVQATATALTMRDTFVRLPAPAATNGNTNADPLFVAPAAGDWHLQPASPANGRANQGIALLPDGPDAYGGVRVAGPLDTGGDEVGPEPAPPALQLELAAPTMARGGGGMPFRVQYPAETAGMLSVLLLQLGPPSGSFPAFGATIPLAPVPELLVAATDPLAVNAVALIPPSGVVSGALLWGGRLPPTVQNTVVSLCAVAFDFTAIRAVSDVATFTVR